MGTSEILKLIFSGICHSDLKRRSNAIVILQVYRNVKCLQQGSAYIKHTAIRLSETSENEGSLVIYTDIKVHSRNFGIKSIVSKECVCMCPNFMEKYFFIFMCQDKPELGYLGMRLVNTRTTLFIYYISVLAECCKNVSNGGEGKCTYVELAGSG